MAPWTYRTSTAKLRVKTDRVLVVAYTTSYIVMTVRLQGRTPSALNLTMSISVWTAILGMNLILTLSVRFKAPLMIIALIIVLMMAIKPFPIPKNQHTAMASPTVINVLWMNAPNAGKDTDNNTGQGNVFYLHRKIVLKDVAYALPMNVSIAHKDTLLKVSHLVRAALSCIQEIPKENAKLFKEIAQHIPTASPVSSENVLSVNKDLLSTQIYNVSLRLEK